MRLCGFNLHVHLAAFGGLIALLLALPAHAKEKYFSDDFIGYRYGTQFKEPATADGANITKNILSYQHYNTDRLGNNFLNVDALLSHSNDPAKNSSQGATEFYIIYRRNWSMHALTGYDLKKTGFLRDVALHMGGDINTKDTSFAPRKKLLVIGPQLQFDLAKGFFNVAFDYSREWNHNGIVGKNVNFDAAFQVEMVWGYPFKVNDTSWKFQGFFTYVAPKGKDGFGSETAAEIITRPELMLDAGELLGAGSNRFEVGAGYEYWHNKYGNDHDRVPGSFATTPMIITRVHF